MTPSNEQAESTQKLAQLLLDAPSRPVLAEENVPTNLGCKSSKSPQTLLHFYSNSSLSRRGKHNIREIVDESETALLCLVDSKNVGGGDQHQRAISQVGQKRGILFRMFLLR